MKAEYHHSPEKFGYIGIIHFTNHYIGTIPKVMVSWWGCPSMGQKVPQARWMVYFIGKSKKKRMIHGVPP
jgi:hypothetical protein